MAFWLASMYLGSPERITSFSFFLASRNHLMILLASSALASLSSIMAWKSSFGFMGCAKPGVTACAVPVVFSRNSASWAF